MCVIVEAFVVSASFLVEQHEQVQELTWPETEQRSEDMQHKSWQLEVGKIKLDVHVLERLFEVATLCVCS